MGIKAVLAKRLARRVTARYNAWNKQAVSIQRKTLLRLVKAAAGTQFGKEHRFSEIGSHPEFAQNVPLRDYEQLRPWVDRIIAGEKNVLWRGHPRYFAETSGTTSGAKFIPITKASIPNQIKSARDCLLHYIHETGDSRFVDGKMLFISGSPRLEQAGAIRAGRLSGIVNHHVPAILRRNHLPTFETNCIEDWEQKLDQIVEETIGQNMTLVAGMPPWVQTYFDVVQRRTGKLVGEVFPGLSVLVHVGVNFDPYAARLSQSIGRPVDTVENYAASEGFLAFQDVQSHQGLLLNVNSGIFFEFIPLSEIDSEQPTRLTLGEVETDVNYAVVISSNAGLWGYVIGDTVKFVSTDPYRLLVTGRVKHFTSAFGEHVIAEEVEQSLLHAADKRGIVVTEFTVAPHVGAKGESSYHEWFIEFERAPAELEGLADEIDQHLQSLNGYYKVLRQGKMLETIRITSLKPGAFHGYMKSKGKLGGQNKVPRLSNDREIAEELAPWVT